MASQPKTSPCARIRLVVNGWIWARPVRVRPSSAIHLKPIALHRVRIRLAWLQGDQKFNSTITVLKDPHSDGTLNDIQAQNALLAKIHADVNTMADIVNEAELIRRQLSGDMRDMLANAKRNQSDSTGSGKLIVPSWLQKVSWCNSNILAVAGCCSLSRHAHRQDGIPGQRGCRR